MNNEELQFKVNTKKKIQALENIVLSLLIGRKVLLHSGETVIVEDVYREKIMGVGKNLDTHTKGCSKYPYIKFSVDDIKYIYGVDEC